MTIDELGKLYIAKRTELLLLRVPLDGWIAAVSLEDAQELDAESKARMDVGFPFGGMFMGATWTCHESVAHGDVRIWRRCMKLDAKFYGEIRKVKDETLVPEDEYVVFLAKDNAFAAILPAYREKCVELGCDTEQIAAVDRMMLRLDGWRTLNPERCKNPDAAAEKLLG